MILNCTMKFYLIAMGTVLFSCFNAFLLGTEMTRTPSWDRLDTTSSGLALSGSPYLLENCLETITWPASDFSSCFPSTHIIPCPASTFSSSGLYPLVSNDISSLFSSSVILICVLSLLLKIESAFVPNISGVIHSEDLPLSELLDDLKLDSKLFMLSSNLFRDSSKKFL